jgi:hypothetical protein
MSPSVSKTATVPPLLTAALAATAIPEQNASQLLEERWGVQITQIEVTADGGMVDFRFRVTDPRKAAIFLKDPQYLPILVAEDTHVLIGTALPVEATTQLETGKVYIFLYSNPRHAIQSDGYVSIVIGDMRFEHYRIQ